MRTTLYLKGQVIDEPKFLREEGERQIFTFSIRTADMECFPVDVWIARILRTNQVTQEDIEKYKHCAGFLNQIIYFYAIMHRDEFTKKEE